MRFWFEHSSEVSLREQVVAQISLGILCGELAPGERLPSIRELARRFDLHANTVSAGYRQLEAEGWVESRRGSGVYVRAGRPLSSSTPGAALSRLVANLFASAGRLGIPPSEVVERVRHFVQAEGFGRLVLVEPDPELRAIVQAELVEFASLPIEGCGFEHCAGLPGGALLLALPSKFDRVQALVPSARVLALKVRSVPASLAEHLPPREARTGLLIGIASRWPEFLRFARTMLVAAGLEAEALIVRDAREPGWNHGLEATAATICDLQTARLLPGVHTIVSRILDDAVPDSLRRALLPPPAAHA